MCEIVLCNVVARSIEKFIRYYFPISSFLIWMFALVRKLYQESLIIEVRAIAKTKKTRFRKGDRYEKVLRIVLLLS